MTNLRRALKGAAIAVALAGTAIGTIGAADAQTVYYGSDPNGGGYYGQNGYYSNQPYRGYDTDRYNNDGYNYGGYDGGRYGYGRDRGATVFSLSLGNVAFGYRDGYWDRRHHWHHWQRDSDYRYYRDHGTNYYGYNHDRYDNDGWRY